MATEAVRDAAATAQTIRYADMVLPDKTDVTSLPAAFGVPVAKQVAPAAERNKGPILEALASRVPTGCRILEIASGTGQHCVHFASALPEVYIQPTDFDSAALASISRYRQDAVEPVRARIGEPVCLDVCDSSSWDAVPGFPYDVVLCTNLLHISPWECTVGLFAGFTRRLPRGLPARMFIYGPFLVDGKPTTESNAAFDARLKGMDARYGLRDIAAVSEQATAHDMALSEVLEMPANNFILVFDRRASV